MRSGMVDSADEAELVRGLSEPKSDPSPEPEPKAELKPELVPQLELEHELGKVRSSLEPSHRLSTACSTSHRYGPPSPVLALTSTYALGICHRCAYCPAQGSSACPMPDTVCIVTSLSSLLDCWHPSSADIQPAAYTYQASEDFSCRVVGTLHHEHTRMGHFKSRRSHGYTDC